MVTAEQLTQQQGFPTSPSLPKGHQPVSGPGDGKAHSLGSWPRLSRDIPQHVASHSAIKSWGIGHLWLKHMSSKATVTHTGACIPGSDWTSAWWQEVENKYPLFASVFYAAFTFLIRLLLSQPLSLFIFYLPDLLRKWIKRTTGPGSQLRSPHHHIYFRAKIDAAHSEVMLGSAVAINLYFRLPRGSQLCWHNRSPRTPMSHSHSWFNKTGQCYLCQF